VPWLWGINGVMSVLGSALATGLAIHVGFRLTLLASAVVYALALILITRAVRVTADDNALQRRDRKGYASLRAAEDL
jgi:predicted MFS family arabinose efflux permease